MDSRCQEFVCADCEADVYSFGGPPDQTLCASCQLIVEMKAERGMTAIQEAKLRELLDCLKPVQPRVQEEPKT